jgi:hypothetical protein
VDKKVSVFINNDEKTMEDLAGRSGADIAKGMIATGIGTVAAIVASVWGAPLIGVGIAFAGVGMAVSFALDGMDNTYGISDTLVDKLKEISQ